MSLNIYFHIDELARDAVVASALKKELESRGHKLTYGNRMSTARLLEKFMPSFDVVIIPRPTFMNAFKSLNENSKYPPIVILFSESVGSVVDLNNDKLTLFGVLDQPFMDGDCPYFKHIAAFLLWGDTTLNRIKKYYPDIVDKFAVVGHPRHNEKCTKFTIAEPKNEKIRVGFITRQTTLNDFAGRKPIDTITYSSLRFYRYYYYNKKTGDFLHNKSNNAIDEVYIEASDIDVMLKIINSLDRDKYEVFLRVHPREDRHTWIDLVEKHKINVKFADWRIPFAHWAKSMDYVVGSASTSFFDCCMLGIKPISIQNINPVYYEHLKGSYAEEYSSLTEHIDKPDSIDSLLELIKDKSDSFVPSEEIRAILSLETDYPNCKSSISKIVDKCLALAEANDKNQLAKYVNLILFNFSFRLLTGVMPVVRWFQRRPEQSSTFFMTRKNIRFIDKLAGD